MALRRRQQKKEWIWIVALALALHAVLFVTIKPDFFAVFKRSLPADRGESGAPWPNAIITIPIEIEDEADPPSERRVEHRPSRREPTMLTQPSESPATDSRERGGQDLTDLDDIVGKAPITLPSPAPESVVVPPRPIEITWPDTRKLKHCLDRFVDVRIHVDDTGKILEVIALDANLHPDCVRAALASARRIVFKPAEDAGKPVSMWTEVRIEFRRKR